MYEALSEAREVWHFDMLNPPQDSDHKTLDMTFTRCAHTASPGSLARTPATLLPDLPHPLVCLTPLQIASSQLHPVHNPIPQSVTCNS